MANSNKTFNSTKTNTEQQEEQPTEYVPQQQEKAEAITDFVGENLRISDTGFTDHTDEEFFDYSEHMRNRTNQQSPNFDIEGDFADNFNYEPSGPQFEFLHQQTSKPKPKKLNETLNELPDEIKALMVSGLFDRKF